MMLSHLLIFSSRGDILIEEKYRYDIPEHDLRSLINIVLKQKPSQYSPYFKFNNINGYAIKNEKVTYLAVSKKELPTIIILQFLENFHSLIRNFCGGASEDYINRNLLLVYELMTECVDNGVIKATSTEQVRHSVYSDPVFTKISFKSEVKKPGPFGLEKKFIPNLAAERPLVKSRSELMNLKNEVFVDVIEKIVVHLSKEGIIQKYKLHGVILMKSFLPLSHKIIVNLEDNLKQGDVMKALIFEQHHFSSCVDDKNFEKHRSFVVTPSQGEVKAMTYYSTTSASFVPFRLLSIVEDVDKNRDCDLTLQLSCNLPSNVEALNVVLHIPVPSTTRNVMQQFSMFENSAEFIQKQRKILWKLKKLPGQGEVTAKFKLIEGLHVPANRLEIGPVSLEFEISNTTCSGLLIRNLKAEDPAGKQIPIQKWVRYVTVAQSYVFLI